MIDQTIAELRMIEMRTKREKELAAIERLNNTDYKLSPESKAALERGDRQRETGIYLSDWDIDDDDTACYATLDDDGVFSEHICSLNKGHDGKHQCVAIGWCNRTWD